MKLWIPRATLGLVTVASLAFACDVGRAGDAPSPDGGSSGGPPSGTPGVGGDAASNDAAPQADGGGGDAPAGDAVARSDGASADAGIPIFAGAPVLYTGDRTLSPINAALVQHLKDIAAAGSGLRPGVVMKVGDSITASSGGVSGGYFFNCFDGTIGGTVGWEFNIKLGGRDALAQTIDYFRATKIDQDDSFTRASLAARVGEAAGWAMDGSPSPLESELAATRAQYAVVMYGSNDIGGYGELADRVETYEAAMRAITDWLIGRGVIPILTTMPPRPAYAADVPSFAGVVRAIAQGRQIPLIDYNRELMALPSPQGLQGDGVHPSCQDYNTCCWFDPPSLKYGYNVRNLITLQALDAVKRVFVDGAPPPDPNAPRLAGDGSNAAPLLIEQLPFGEMRDSRASSSNASEGDGCAGSPATPGPEVFYELSLAEPTALRVLLLDAGKHALHLSLVSADARRSCIASDARLIAGTFPAGTYLIVVDGLTSGGGSEYTLSVTR
jgi:hypothetical protein